MAHARHRLVDPQAIGLADVQVRTKAQFEHEQGMIQQVGAPTRRGAEVFADPDEKSLDVGAGRMGGASWARGLGWRIQGRPVEEGEERAVALHNGIGVEELAQRGLVKLLRAWYDRGHEQGSFQSQRLKICHDFAQELVSLSRAYKTSFACS